MSTMPQPVTRKLEVLRLLDLLPPSVVRDTLGGRAAEFIRSIDPEKVSERDFLRLRDLKEEFLSL